MKRFFFYNSAVFMFGSGFSQPGKCVWDVFDFGAKGDGKSLDTKAIQSAIDQCHEKGGGKVYLHNGQFVSGITVDSRENKDIEGRSAVRGRNCN